jgi:hypothetical protein
MDEADINAEIDHLYGLPLDEFVRQRDAAAKRLRADGERDAAALVKALRKPTAGAWAINQAVRRRGSETQALLGAGERLRAAHAGLLSGGDRNELRAAMDEQRRLAGVLSDCAEAIASETGKSGPALRERVRSTLHAAAVDDEVREQLERGRLVREQEAVGLGGPFGDGAAVASAPRSGGGEAAAKRRRAPHERERSRDRGPSAEERKRSADRAEAERLLAEAEAALESAEAAYEEASERVGAARAAVSEAERAQRETRRTLRDRQRDHARRERELRRLED